MSKFWNMKKKDSKMGELTLSGAISSQTWFGDEVTPKQFKSELDSLGDISTLNVYINSGGGDVFAGQAIHSMLKRHPAKKIVYIDGLAASIASVIAMAGDEIVMPANAMMMVHKAQAVVMGNANAFQKMSDTLSKIDESIAQTYIDKCGGKKTKSQIMAMMDAETWMTAQDAFDCGLCDTIEMEKLLAASIDENFLIMNNQKFDLNSYNNFPKDTIIENVETDREAIKPEPVVIEEKAPDLEQFIELRKKLLQI